MNALIRKIVLGVVVLAVGVGAGSAVTGSLAIFTASTSVTLPALRSDVWRLYLHDRAYGAPVGTQLGQGSLPPGQGTNAYWAIDVVAPTTAVDKNGTPGGIIKWRTVTAAGSRLVKGGTLGIWTETSQNKAATLVLRIIDRNAATATDILIATATLSRANWMQGSSVPVFDSIVFPTVAYTLPGGHELVLEVDGTVGSIKAHFDCTQYPSYLILG
jgi:hypothetical protein